MNNHHQQQSVARSAAWLRAQDSAMGFNITVDGDSTCDAPMLQGAFHMLKGLSGIELQCCRHREMRGCTVATRLPPGAVFVYLTHGAIEFYLQGQRFAIQAEAGLPMAFAFNLTQTTEFKRVLRAGNDVEKLVLTLSPACGQIILAQESFAALRQQFFCQHMQTRLWCVAEADTSLCQRIIACENSSHGGYCPLVQEAAMLSLLQSTLQRLEPAAFADVPVSTGARIEQHLNQWIATHRSAEPIDVSKIAMHLNMSSSKLQRAFKQHCGTSVMEYIRKQRLLQAKQAMKVDGVSIGEAAFRAGYKHSSNFCLAFKKTFGYSPGDVKTLGDTP